MDINKLVKKITSKIIKESTPIIGLYPGKFKPPHKGHLNVVKKALNECDEVHIIISNKIHEGYSPELSKKLWEIYTKNLPQVKISIAEESTPVTQIYKEIKDDTNNYLVIYGKGEEDRYKAINENREKYSNADIINAGNFDDISATQLREAIKNKDHFKIKNLIPKEISVRQFLNEIKINKPKKFIISKNENGQFYIEFKNKKYYGNWELEAVTGHGFFTIHKYNPSNKNIFNLLPKDKYNEGDTYSIPESEIIEKYNEIKISSPKSSKRITYHPFIGYNESKSLNEVFDGNKHKNTIYKAIDYVCDDLGIEKPEIEFIDNPNYTEEHSSFAGYSPTEKKVFVVTYNRNTADIMRSIAHELRHMYQDIHGQLTMESGEDGDEVENDANAYAGKIMREIGRKFPEIFENKQSLNEIKVQTPGLKNKIINLYNDYIDNTQDTYDPDTDEYLYNILIKHFDYFSIGDTKIEQVINDVKDHNILYKQLLKFYQKYKEWFTNKYLNEIKISTPTPKLDIQHLEGELYVFYGPYSPQTGSFKQDGNFFFYIHHDPQEVNSTKSFLDKKRIQYIIDEEMDPVYDAVIIPPNFVNIY